MEEIIGYYLTLLIRSILDEKNLDSAKANRDRCVLLLQELHIEKNFEEKTKE